MLQKILWAKYSYTEYVMLSTTLCLQIFVIENFLIKIFILKIKIFGIKFLWISINFVKVQIDMSYYVGNIRRQNGFVSTCIPNSSSPVS